MPDELARLRKASFAAGFALLGFVVFLTVDDQASLKLADFPFKLNNVGLVPVVLVALSAYQSFRFWLRATKLAVPPYTFRRHALNNISLPEVRTMLQVSIPPIGTVCPISLIEGDYPIFDDADGQIAVFLGEVRESINEIGSDPIQIFHETIDQPLMGGDTRDIEVASAIKLPLKTVALIRFNDFDYIAPLTVNLIALALSFAKFVAVPAFGLAVLRWG